MTTTTHSISRDELAELLKGPDKPIVVDTLPAEHFQKAHIPTAVNLPVGAEGRAPKLLPDKNAKIVVYCKHPG